MKGCKQLFSNMDSKHEDVVANSSLLTSNEILILFGKVKCSTGTALLAATAASDSFCSRSLFFLFSSCEIKGYFITPSEERQLYSQPFFVNVYRPFDVFFPHRQHTCLCPFLTSSSSFSSFPCGVLAHDQTCHRSS